MPGHTPEDRQFKSGYDSFRRATPDRTSQNFGSNIVIGRPDPSGGRRQAYEDMASQGIRSLSGATTDDRAGVQARGQQRVAGRQYEEDTGGKAFTDMRDAAFVANALAQNRDKGILSKFNLPELNLTFGKPIKDLSEDDLNKILNEVKRYQEGLPNYFEGFPGGLNFAKGFADSISQGTERSGEFGGVEGSPTLQGLTEFIRGLDPDSNMLDSFKEADPATYLDVFGLPATDAGLDFFAGLDIGQADKKTSQLIMEARKRLQDAQSRQDANMGQGIMAASPALPGISVPAGGTTITPRPGPITPTNPVLTPVPVGGISPFNINQFYASLPQYTQQGIMNPNLAQFYQNLQAFPRVV